ncbi:MAG: hypothetical protein MUE30_12530, partial [Spirosomaceae bacterium]|nr:hypothetical protein [Spirosomataceae bacterium]
TVKIVIFHIAIIGVSTMFYKFIANPLKLSEHQFILKNVKRRFLKRILRFGGKVTGKGRLILWV